MFSTTTKKLAEMIERRNNRLDHLRRTAMTTMSLRQRCHYRMEMTGWPNLCVLTPQGALQSAVSMSRLWSHENANSQQALYLGLKKNQLYYGSIESRDTENPSFWNSLPLRLIDPEKEDPDFLLTVINPAMQSFLGIQTP